MIERERHGSEGSCADGDDTFDGFGIIDCPLQCLHPAERAANDRFKSIDAQLGGGQPLRTHNVANGDARERASIRLAGGWIDAGGAGGSVAGAESVETDDTFAIEIENLIQQQGPPLVDARRARKRVTHQNDVVLRFVGLAVNGVAHVNHRQRGSGFKHERLVVRNAAGYARYSLREVIRGHYFLPEPTAAGLVGASVATATFSA